MKLNLRKRSTIEQRIADLQSRLKQVKKLRTPTKRLDPQDESNVLYHLRSAHSSLNDAIGILYDYKIGRRP